MTNTENLSAFQNGVDRARYGCAAVRAGSPDYGQNDAATDIVDALANVLHFAATLDLDLNALINSARGHVDAELARRQ